MPLNVGVPYTPSRESKHCLRGLWNRTSTSQLKKEKCQESTGAVIIIRSISMDSGSKRWLKNPIFLPSGVDFGLLFLPTSPWVSKFFLPALPKLVWCFSSVRAFPHQLREASFGFHDVDRFHHDLEVDELNLPMGDGGWQLFVSESGSSQNQSVCPVPYFCPNQSS